MSQESPAAKFLTTLEAYIDTRIAKASLPHQRMHARELAAAQKLIDESSGMAKDNLEAAVADLFKETRRFGI